MYMPEDHFLQVSSKRPSFMPTDELRFFPTQATIWNKNSHKDHRLLLGCVVFEEELKLLFFFQILFNFQNGFLHSFVRYLSDNQRLSVLLMPIEGSFLDLLGTSVPIPGGMPWNCFRTLLDQSLTSML